MALIASSGAQEGGDAVLDQPAHGVIGLLAADQGNGDGFAFDTAVLNGFLDAWAISTGLVMAVSQYRTTRPSVQ